MQRHQSPTALWDYACLYVARIHNMTVNQHPAAQGRTRMRLSQAKLLISLNIRRFIGINWFGI